MKNTIAIITARGGSKRIPHKNIKDFFGKPMIAYAIDAAIRSNLFATTMVSTDDAAIAAVAKQYGAEVPFMRSARTANDYAVTHDVLIEVIQEYKNMSIEFDDLCCIYPCVPFLKAETLVKAYKLFAEHDADSLMPVSQFSHPIQRALHITDDGLMEYVQPEHVKSRTQDLEPCYHDVGMFYFYKTAALFQQYFTRQPVIMQEWEIQDLDTEDDWKYAEVKYDVLKSKLHGT
jgi:N-acylneuraminate cytidylyltransferase